VFLHPIILFPKFRNSGCQNSGISGGTKDRKFRNSEIPELQSLVMEMSSIPAKVEVHDDYVTLSQMLYLETVKLFLIVLLIKDVEILLFPC